MGIRCYLAMTQGELANCPRLPPEIGYMACHFSPYGTGLSDLPEQLPPGALLLCDDRIPLLRHDKALVARQLAETAARLRCHAIVLDFQAPPSAPEAEIVRAVSQLAECPVAVPPDYAGDTTGPVLLPPPPLWEPIAVQTAPWKGRELWMEWVLQTAQIRVTEQGAEYSPLEAPPEETGTVWTDEKLCCRYRMAVGDREADFFLWDTVQTLKLRQEAAEKAGITTLLGLYQQLGPMPMAASVSSPTLAE